MRDCELVWPNFYVVGGQKCGTTSLWAYLKQHRDVFLPDVKEPHFFADVKRLRPSKASRFPNDLESYQTLYRRGHGYPAIGDASPSYLSDEDAPQLIHEVAPDARIIILLRDPVDRAFSHYLMPVMRTVETLPFLEAVRQDYVRPEKGWGVSKMYVDLGLYYTPVRRYLETFGRDHVLIILFDDLQKRPQQVLEEVARHLGIDPEGFCGANVSEVHNPHKEVRFQRAYRFATFLLDSDKRQRLPGPVRKWLSSSPLLYKGGKPARSLEASKFLQEIYEPDIRQLEKFLGRPFPELRRTWV